MNLPAALLNSLEAVPGFDQEAFLLAHQQAAPTSIRLHPQKGKVVPIEGLAPVPWCEGAYYLPQRPVFTTDPSLHAGAYYVQEASSMFLDTVFRHLFQGKENLRLLDLCAAPGGKSTLLAAQMNASSLLISNDVIRSRAAILEANMTRWGYPNTWVSSNDPREFGRMGAYFDMILVDAPCSGSGLFRKDSKAINEWSEANVQLCAERQQRILADVWPALKKDGYLVYATCSYSPMENEAILDFLADQMSVSSVSITVSEDWGIQLTQSPKHQLRAYRFAPHQIKGEGFFLAVLQKTEGEETFQYPRFRSAQQKDIARHAAQLLQMEHPTFVENERKEYTAINALHEPDYQFLREYIYLRRLGTLLGSPSAKEWLPDHDVALSVFAQPDLPALDLDLEKALLFLKKESFALPEHIAKGWYLVRYKGNGLGWIKALGNRFNNYLPKHWRIRMDIDFDALQE